MDDASFILPFRRGTLASPTEVRHAQHRELRYNAGLPSPFVDALWHDPETFFATGKLLRATHLRAAALVRLNSQPFIIKHYYRRSWRHSIDQTIHGPEALRTYELGCLLADGGVRTPRPVACVNNLRCGKFHDSYLLYPYIEGRMLRSSINQELLTDAELERARIQLTEMWQQLRALKVGLKDANAGNFIVSPNGVVWLIDLDGSRVFHNPVVARLRLQLSWQQVNRSMRRAFRERGKPCAEMRREAMRRAA